MLDLADLGMAPKILERFGTTPWPPPGCYPDYWPRGLGQNNDPVQFINALTMCISVSSRLQSQWNTSSMASRSAPSTSRERLWHYSIPRGADQMRRTSHAIRRIRLASSGLVTLLKNGLVQAARGLTSLQEVLYNLPRLTKLRPLRELQRLAGEL